MKDCPECYSGGDCTTQASTQVGTAETQLDVLAGNVYCETVVDKAKNKCSDMLAKSLAKLPRRQGEVLREMLDRRAEGDHPGQRVRAAGG